MLPLTLVVFLSACHKWVPLHAPVETAIQAEQPHPVRLTLADGRRLELLNASVVADSVVGASNGRHGELTPLRTAVSLAEVRSVEGRRGDALATVGVVLPSVAAVVLIHVVSCGEGENTTTIPCE
jgi:hypothetical protein